MLFWFPLALYSIADLGKLSEKGLSDIGEISEKLGKNKLPKLILQTRSKGAPFILGMKLGVFNNVPLAETYTG
ncbi:hypothetical protein AGMMS49531_03500 [Endomicrobiia bacterium]|nr:hypothetical protein AGMMS49531_03500 [Endomicrobiia bacterium]